VTVEATPLTVPMLDTTLTADLCVKCNICTSACPVAAVTDLFPGPKVVGPQAQRFRAPEAVSVDRSVDYCSACGVCSRVCPHGIQIAEMNLIAKQRMAERDGIPLRNRLLGRSELLGKVGSVFAPLSNFPIQNGLLRGMAERVLGIARHAAFPRFARPTFRATFKPSVPAAPAHKVVYFHGCSTNYYEPRVGQAAVRVLEHNGCEVTLAEQNCCGLPMQSNSEFDAARSYARRNLDKLAPYVRQGYVIVGTSTSCTLALKHEYHAVLGLDGEDAALVAGATYDFFEFLQRLEAEGCLKTDFRKLPGRSLAYHAPCQFRAHGVGRPAADLMRLIPGVSVSETRADCCGVAGTYGLKAEKYKIARDVGRPLYDEIAATGAHRIACDSETCRWWLAQHTGLPAVHPVEVLAEAYGL
jgi:glycerol-3-phosphate dehydrogenase subunit C